jgi:hypothetical protein
MILSLRIATLFLFTIAMLSGCKDWLLPLELL